MNHTKPTDPRILRTRQLIRDAFIQLLQEMDVEKITVNRIAERATINRVTFYLHYRDIPDLLEKLADEMIEDISDVLGQIPADEEVNWNRMIQFLEHIAENADFYKVVLSSKRIPIFRDRLSMLLRDTIITRLDSRGSEIGVLKSGIQKEILIWYDSAALIGTITAWLENDMPYTPAFLARQFSMIHTRSWSASLPS